MWHKSEKYCAEVVQNWWADSMFVCIEMIISEKVEKPKTSS